MRNLIVSILIAAAALASGCATAPMAPAERDQQAKAFQATPGAVNLYVYRNESFGAAISMDVIVDGHLVGTSVAKSYFLVQLKPGKHTVLSNAENVATLDFTGEPGHNYFVWQEVKMGLMRARNELHLVDDATGRAGVGECKLLEGAR